MAEATQFKFTLTELATILIKEQGIHEGMWIAAPEFSFGASMMGTSPEVSFPTAIVQMQGLILNAAPPGILPLTPGLIDAATVNPRPKKSPKS